MLKSMASNHYRASDALNIISCMTMGLIESAPAPLSERERDRRSSSSRSC